MHDPSPHPRRAGAQRGSLVVIVLLVAAVVALLVTLSLGLARSASSGSGNESREAVALQAADAGVNRYLARMAADRTHHLTRVDEAEDPRVPLGGGTPVGPGEPWPGGTWTYAGAATTFAPLEGLSTRHGPVEYGLRVYPDPEAGPEVLTLQAVGRVGGDRPQPLTRAVQVRLQPASLASFQIISDRSITLAESTHTDGQVYSNGDVNHRGTADGPLFAQGFVCDQGGSLGLPGIISSANPQPCGGVSDAPQFQSGAFDRVSSPSIDEEIPAPIDFGRFEEARLAVRAAAQSGGLYFNSATASSGGLLEAVVGTLGLGGWMARLEENPSGPGRITVWPIINLNVPLMAKLLNLLGIGLPVNMPLLGCPTTHTLPANGAVYFEQPVVLSSKLEASLLCGSQSLLGGQTSVVDGEVTIAGGGDIHFGGDVRYAETGENVLGLLARGDIGVSVLAIGVTSTPLQNDVDIRAAAVSTQGHWRTGLPLGLAVPLVASKGLLHAKLSVTGMLGAADGLDVSQYQSSELSYDPTLDELPPPYFPTFDRGWATGYWRQVTPPAG